MSEPSNAPALLALQPPGGDAPVREGAQRAGMRVEVVATLPALLDRLRARPWSATLLSLTVDPVDEALAARVSAEANSGALLLSARAVTLDRAVAAERSGALTLLGEPVDAVMLADALERISDEGPEVDLPSATAQDEDHPVIVGESPEIGSVVQQLARVAGSDTTVLVTGESGTGKEVVARALHWASPRARGPFVAVNCAAIPEHLLESELFGHERGAFTGAVGRRIGRFERASGGTLFLDEIGDMSLVLQAKVLRALEERVVEPVGATEARPFDARIVAATNQHLGTAMSEGRFREDLYYRLAVVELQLPALRDRGNDVRLLALHFAAHFASRHGRPVRAVTRAALDRLRAAPWPGNIRELRNVMDRAVLLASGDVIRSGDLRIGAGAPRTSASLGGSDGAAYAPTLSLQEVEADHIRRVLAFVDGHVGRAAETLGIHRNTLARKIRDYGIRPDAAKADS